MKKRGFTLIELLIVTVVIAILMAIVFRLAGTGSDSAARAKTISRLQKISNALSGYYAAFGSYPPVPLQGRSRDIYTRVDNSGSMGHGIQSKPDDRNTPSFESVYGEIKFVRGANTNTKVVTVRKGKFYVMEGCNLPASAQPTAESDKKDEKKKK